MEILCDFDTVFEINVNAIVCNAFIFGAPLKI